MNPGVLLVRNAAEADEPAGQRASATKLQAWIASREPSGAGVWSGDV